jgi:hypothetical protein
MGYFYQYNAGLPHVSTLASTVNMMAIRFDSYGNNKLVEFWRRWVDLERDVGASMKPEMKIIKLYAEMNKFKNIKEEMLTFDKLPLRKRTFQAGYDALLDILEREAEREMNKVDDARALKPLETAMSGVNGPRDPKGLHYTDESTPKDKGKGKKGKGGDSPPGKGLGKQNDPNSHKNSTEKGKGGKSDEKGKGKKGGKGDEGKGDPKGKGKKGKGGDKGKGEKMVKPEDVASLDALPKLEIPRMCDMYTRHRHDNGPPCPYGAECKHGHVDISLADHRKREADILESRRRQAIRNAAREAAGKKPKTLPGAAAPAQAPAQAGAALRQEVPPAGVSATDIADDSAAWKDLAGNVWTKADDAEFVYQYNQRKQNARKGRAANATAEGVDDNWFDTAW